jgi:hypothetical protein
LVKSDLIVGQQLGDEIDPDFENIDPKRNSDLRKYQKSRIV